MNCPLFNAPGNGGLICSKARRVEWVTLFATQHLLNQGVGLTMKLLTQPLLVAG